MSLPDTNLIIIQGKTSCVLLCNSKGNQWLVLMVIHLGYCRTGNIGTNHKNFLHANSSVVSEYHQIREISILGSEFLVVKEFLIRAAFLKAALIISQRFLWIFCSCAIFYEKQLLWIYLNSCFFMVTTTHSLVLFGRSVFEPTCASCITFCLCSLFVCTRCGKMSIVLLIAMTGSARC